MAETRKSNVTYYVWSVIALVLIFGFGRVVPAFAGITPVGISVLGIFLGVLIAILAQYAVTVLVMALFLLGISMAF